MTTEFSECRYFVSYSGIKLPLKLVNELHGSGRQNRNTYFLGYFDRNDRLLRCEKRVYGEIDLLHCYHYHDNGALKFAEITDVDGDVTVLEFDEQGNPLEVSS